MKTELLLSLRDIALKQNHIAYIMNSHLIIQFFQDPSYNIDEAIQLKIDGNENELTIQVQYKLGRIQISEEGEKKLTHLFNTFILTFDYKGVIRLNENADIEFCGIKLSFFDFLNQQKVQLKLSDLNKLSSLLKFPHTIKKDTYYVIYDETKTLQFLGITTYIRPLPQGKIAMIQRLSENSITIFESIKSLAKFLNECYEKAILIRSKWQQILNGTVYHQFILENKTLIFCSGYSMSLVNNQFIAFTDMILKAKNYFTKLNLELEEQIDSFYRNNFEINSYILDFNKDFCLSPSTGDNGFNVFTLEYKFMNKQYLLRLSFDSLINSFILQVNDQSYVFIVNEENKLDALLNTVKLKVNSYLDTFFNELLDGKELIDKLLKIKTFNFNDFSIKLLQSDTYLLYESPDLPTMPFICVQRLVGTKTFTKKELLSYIKEMIELNNCIDQMLLNVINFFNYQRNYDPNGVFISIENNNLYINTPFSMCSMKFRVLEDYQISLIVTKNTKELSFPITLSDFVYTTIGAIEKFESKTILTYVFGQESITRDIAYILSRYTLNRLFEINNRTSLCDEELQRYIEKILYQSQFPFTEAYSMKNLIKWKTKKITELQDIFQNSEISLIYNETYHSVYIEQK
ncbi:hypothetical protein [Bacillus toyonensis]|uniref:hypothetical protein n=1 Tax=Bacillus toyonensis TaxID=155322 RepID=UPI002E1AF5EB|nr:hypothetical protein [Bacillus toyonensis]